MSSFLKCANREKGWRGALRRFLRLNLREHLQAAEALIASFHALECQPVHFFPTKRACPKDYQELFQAAEHLLRELAEDKDYAALRLSRLLKRVVIGAQYRLEESNGGLFQADAERGYAVELFQLASRWRREQELEEEAHLSDRDKQILLEAARYPEFVNLLKEDREVRVQFFLWSLRDKLSVAVFIQYPHIQQKIVDVQLSGRISRIGSHLLRIQLRKIEATIQEKIVTLPFEGREISLLDEDVRICLAENYELTLKQVFEIFKEKEIRIGRLEFLSQGVTNWNAHKLGRWSEVSQGYVCVDFTAPGWWKQLPVTETLTLSQAIERYGPFMDGVRWAVAACGTRSRRSLDPKGSHAFLEVAIPSEQGLYSVYSFGKFALKWAITAWETLVAFTDNHHATIAYPDENIFMVHRQLARRTYEVSPHIGMQIMGHIKQDILKAWQGNFIYQWEGDNCAKWVQDLLTLHLKDAHQILDLRVPMLHSQPSDASRYLFAAICRLPYGARSPLLSMLHYTLGAWRGKWIERQEGKKEWCSLTTSSFWEEKVVYLPAMIHVHNHLGERVPIVAAPSEFALDYALAFTP